MRREAMRQTWRPTNRIGNEPLGSLKTLDKVLFLVVHRWSSRMYNKARSHHTGGIPLHVYASIDLRVARRSTLGEHDEERRRKAERKDDRK